MNTIKAWMRIVAVCAGLALAVPTLASGYSQEDLDGTLAHLSQRQSEAVELYNRGVAAAQEGDNRSACRYFGLAAEIYEDLKDSAYRVAFANAQHPSAHDILNWGKQMKADAQDARSNQHKTCG
jgi:hypothetical protein